MMLKDWLWETFMGDRRKAAAGLHVIGTCGDCEFKIIGDDAGREVIICNTQDSERYGYESKDGCIHWVNNENSARFQNIGVSHNQTPTG